LPGLGRGRGKGRKKKSFFHQNKNAVQPTELPVFSCRPSGQAPGHQRKKKRLQKRRRSTEVTGKSVVFFADRSVVVSQDGGQGEGEKKKKKKPGNTAPGRLGVAGGRKGREKEMIRCCETALIISILFSANAPAFPGAEVGGKKNWCVRRGVKHRAESGLFCFTGRCFNSPGVLLSAGKRKRKGKKKRDSRREGGKHKSAVGGSRQKSFALDRLHRVGGERGEKKKKKE